MIYRDRKYLSILTLSEDRDYVTYDELIRVLEDRPSSAIYIERDGTLCGLITPGRVQRSREEKTRRVPFNKKFTLVRPGEYMRVRQIFRDKANINMLPVVSADGRLLGDYARPDDPIGTDYAELLLKAPYVLQGLKESVQDVVLVEPSTREGAYKHRMFAYWIQQFENSGIRLRVIQHREIKDYHNKIFLFVDEYETLGAEALYQRLYQQNPDNTYISIIDYLYSMRRIADLSFLKELQKQSITVLAFDFKENDNRFLAELNGRIRKRNEEYGIQPVSCLPEELKESFLDELYCGAYKETNKFPPPWSCHTQFGIPYLSDAETELYHVRNGERFTVDQPEEYDRCMYLYGPCVVAGGYVSDQYTIASLLQREINQAGFSCRVVNRGVPGGDSLDIERLISGSFRQGDIIVFDQYLLPVEYFPILNLTDALEKHDAPADWFIEAVRHCNHKANQVFAHAIYEELTPVLRQPPKGREPIGQDHDYVGRFYLKHYFSDFDPTGHGVIGSIVMNCNPFTFGHRFLIEEALKTVDFLLIFVVEEDESVFSFQERFAMVCQGTADLERVMAVPSGPYILSKNTFPEYFQKIDDEDLKKNTEDDITLFAEKIAPKLGIKYRFVGEEREDKVTNEYNEAMKRILPRYGIQVVEIPRKTNSKAVISASRVRHCLSTDHMKELDELVPASTKHILFSQAE